MHFRRQLVLGQGLKFHTAFPGVIHQIPAAGDHTPNVLGFAEKRKHIGRDRGSPVANYAAPFEFTGKLRRVVVTMDEDQVLDGDGIGEAEMARQ